MTSEKKIGFPGVLNALVFFVFFSVLLLIAGCDAGSLTEGHGRPGLTEEAIPNDAGGNGAANGAANGGAPNDLADEQSDDMNGETSGRAWFQLSPDDSTSMATAQLLKLDHAVYGMTLYPHEVVNYYDPPASYRASEHFSRNWETEDDIFVGVQAAMANETQMDVLVHIFAPQVPVAQRTPWNLHLCVDVSGSMYGDRLVYTKEAMKMLVNAMRTGDRLSLTVFNSTGRLELESTAYSSAGKAEMIAAIDGLNATGGTNMKAGLDIAYAQAQGNYDSNMLNRVILFSDGDANVGETDYEAIADFTRMNNAEGIYLSGVGVGSNYAMGRMDALTDAGKGAHVFLPNAAEVEIVFGPMLRKMIEVAADDISIEVELPAGFSLASFSGEEVSTNPEERVQNVVLAAGDDMTIFATFEAQSAELFAGESMEFTFRYRPLSTGQETVFQQEIAFDDLIADESGLFMERTRLINEYGTGAIERLVKQSDWYFGGEMDGIDADLTALLNRVEAFEPQDPGLEEIAGLLRGWGF